MSDDRYDLTTYDGKTVDKYTRWNLEQAAKILGYDLTLAQGSYHPGVGASAGTHDKGGVVDLVPYDWERKVHVLRELGFAAWHRTELWRHGKRVWPEHIHAVLIGNERLAPLAANQVTAYRNHRDGLAGNGPDNSWHPDPIKPAEYETEAPVPHKLPSDLIDLKPWKLQVAGKDIKHPALDSYESWHMNVSGNAVAFRARVDDPTTPGSHYPRSELRQEASWSTTSRHSFLEAKVAIGHFPPVKPEVVFGQIHDVDDDVIRLLARRAPDGRVHLIASWGKGKNQGSEDVAIGVVKQGEWFKFRIDVTGGHVSVAINEIPEDSRVVKKSGCYFKTGSYTQSNTGYDKAGEYGGVLIAKDSLKVG